MQNKYAEVDWKQWLKYDTTSPSCLRWKVDIYTGMGRKLVSKGDSAGTMQHGRWHVGLNKRRYIVSRVIWAMLVRVPTPDEVVDHKDRNPANNRRRNLRLVSNAINSRNRSKYKRNKSGTTGVRYYPDHPNGYPYWVASWVELNGKMRQKYFSVPKLGHDAAKAAAIEFRLAKIDQLNSSGAGYTERHGK